ncbi:PEP-CTERM sorting domain-containing protein [Massilia sp. CF038]|uniref:PEP-CTERM sorting domain-containing protein n=1 Tax=Massilia sp. CF038 TaxID=1881045 RepID=UPI000913801F|nr:PEP-CTERM sorting domain-containing protein [Massilia sp. CF038]SHG96371.1 VPLPA-CTERM protein sorting domain-containing protein [Massilia sp. CF038]
MKIRQIIAAALLAAPAAAFAFPIADAGTEGLAVLAGNGAVVATYQGNSASYSNDLYLVTDDGVDNNDIFIFNNHTSPVGSMVDLGAFTFGTELVFRLHVNNTNADYYTGAASRNADNSFHARVQENWALNTTLVSFEDLLGGPFDFNDLSFSFTNTATTPGQVPEPASMLLMGLGLAGIAAARRRKAK